MMSEFGDVDRLHIMNDCVLTDCNKNLMNSNGRITSPGYPGSYPANVHCDVTVTAPVGSTLALYFTQFYIEPHTLCRYDYLQVCAYLCLSVCLSVCLCDPTLQNESH